MKREDFISEAAGTCGTTPGGYLAFYPAALPPKLELDWSLAALLSEADRAMAELSGAGQLLPNPHLLIRPYLRREAILSSRIENTIAGMEELALFEAQEDQKPKRPMCWRWQITCGRSRRALPGFQHFRSAAG